MPPPESKFHNASFSAFRSSPAQISHPPANRTALGNLIRDPDPAVLTARDPKEARSQGSVPSPAPLRRAGRAPPAVPRYLREALPAVRPRPPPREGHGSAGHRRPPPAPLGHGNGRAEPARRRLLMTLGRRWGEKRGPGFLAFTVFSASSSPASLAGVTGRG